MVLLIIYRLAIYNKLRHKLHDYRRRLIAMDNYSPEQIQNLSIIASGYAWRYIMLCHYAAEKTGASDLSEIKNNLLLMQEEENNPNEKLALNLYIRQVEILEKVDLLYYHECPFIPVVLVSDTNMTKKVTKLLLEDLRYKGYRFRENK